VCVCACVRACVRVLESTFIDQNNPKRQTASPHWGSPKLDLVSLRVCVRGWRECVGSLTHTHSGTRTRASAPTIHTPRHPTTRSHGHAHGLARAHRATGARARAITPTVRRADTAGCGRSSTEEAPSRPRRRTSSRGALPMPHHRAESCACRVCGCVRVSLDYRRTAWVLGLYTYTYLHTYVLVFV
jgi:hypothetical protein